LPVMLVNLSTVKTLAEKACRKGVHNQQGKGAQEEVETKKGNREEEKGSTKKD